MMVASVLCTKKRLQLCIKVLFVALVIGIYFVVLLRESFAAWESSSSTSTSSLSSSSAITLQKVKNGANIHRNHFNEEQKRSANRIQHKRRGLNKSIAAETAAETAAAAIRSTTTINPIYEYSEELNAAAEYDFTKRRNHLWQMCSKYEFNGRYTPNAWEFFISPGHGIAWCNIFKAASSTWMYYFNILGGYDVKFLQRTKASPLELARKRFPRPSSAELSDALSNSLSFLIVREPFERLLSAYRNKLEGHRNKYYKLLGEQIIKEFRKGNKRKPPGPTFKEFIMFLIENYANERRFDEHWSPIYSFCTPCSINYTLIAKVETFQRDTEYIIRQAGLETLLLNKMPDKKIRSITNESSRQTAKLIPKYFSQIDDTLLIDLLNVYGPDFDLFGYNSTKYFNIVKSSKPPAAPTTIATKSIVRTTTITTVAKTNQ